LSSEKKWYMIFASKRAIPPSMTTQWRIVSINLQGITN